MQADRRPARPGRSLSRRRETPLDYLIFMGPAMILFTALFLIPLVSEVFYSFTNWNGINPTFKMVGLKNYNKAFRDSRYWTSLIFTIKFSICVVFYSNLIAFCWSYILSKDIPLRNFWRALIYVPRIIGGVILGYLWRFIFQNVFVQFGQWSGIKWFSQAWFTTQESSFWALVIVMTWSSSGYMMIIYLAGLTSVSTDYIEAAVVDGAKSRHILFKVILPLIMPSVTQGLFLSIVNSLRMYDLNISLTNGNPFRLSEAVTMNVYQTAFSSNQLGYGSAKAMILVIVIAVISLLQVALTSKKEVSQ